VHSHFLGWNVAESRPCVHQQLEVTVQVFCVDADVLLKDFVEYERVESDNLGYFSFLPAVNMGGKPLCSEILLLEGVVVAVAYGQLKGRLFSQQEDTHVKPFCVEEALIV